MYIIANELEITGTRSGHKANKAYLLYSANVFEMDEMNDETKLLKLNRTCDKSEKKPRCHNSQSSSSVISTVHCYCDAVLQCNDTVTNIISSLPNKIGKDNTLNQSYFPFL